MAPADDPPLPPPNPEPEVPTQPAGTGDEGPEVHVEATDPENRDAIIESIVELEERHWRRLEEEAALPPLPPPPTKRWSFAVPLAICAVIVWVATLRPVRTEVVTAISARAETVRVERLLHTASEVIERYRAVHRRWPAALTDAGPFPAQIHYFPDTGGRFLLEMATTRGIARITVDHGEASFHLYGPTELRPAPPATPPPPKAVQ